jgi:chromatin segregation and condensation protein Rec8/ScpA/Scc1 (kleisin family)
MNDGIKDLTDTLCQRLVELERLKKNRAKLERQKKKRAKLERREKKRIQGNGSATSVTRSPNQYDLKRNVGEKLTMRLTIYNARQKLSEVEEISTVLDISGGLAG